MFSLCRHETLFGSMFHNTNDEVIGKSLQMYGQWAMDEIALFAYLMQQQDGGDFIDLGANVGCHTVALATLFPDRETFAFEANPESFQILATNVTINGLGNVRLSNVLVGETSAMRRVVISRPDRGLNLGAVSFEVVSPTRPHGALALQAAVDDVYPASRSAAVSKADLEGMELQALMGLRATLARCHTSFYFENGAQRNSGPIFSELAKLGYETFWHMNQPFDPDNFRGNSVSVYGNTIEMGTLCIHSDHAAVRELREHLTPTSKPMGDTGWYKCVAFNAELRSRVRAQLASRRSTAALRDYLLDEYARHRTNIVPSSGSATAEPKLIDFSEVCRAVLLDIPNESLRSLLTPLIEKTQLDEDAYLQRHADVAAAVKAGQFSSALHHYVVAGYFEGRYA